jgi:DNA-binding response OmpR family regulator
VYRILLLASTGNLRNSLLEEVKQAGLSWVAGSDLSFIEDIPPDQSPQAALLDLASFNVAQARDLVDSCRERNWPVLVVVPLEAVNSYDPSLNPDEFILDPFQPGELVARIKQAIYRVNGPSGQQVLRIGDLAIDLDRYDVTMAGRRVSLTYKEFQLLALLASNPGRVYSRENLLSQVWGYDYLGGTRTVDVHVRRLRSKIEDPDHSFVETIWNVGYRFKVPS